MTCYKYTRVMCSDVIRCIYIVEFYSNPLSEVVLLIFTADEGLQLPRAGWSPTTYRHVGSEWCSGAESATTGALRGRVHCKRTQKLTATSASTDDMFMETSSRRGCGLRFEEWGVFSGMGRGQGMGRG